MMFHLWNLNPDENCKLRKFSQFLITTQSSHATRPPHFKDPKVSIRLFDVTMYPMLDLRVWMRKDPGHHFRPES